MNDPVVARIVQHLRECGPSTFAELSYPVSVEERALDRALQKARRKGLITYDRSARKWHVVQRQKRSEGPLFSLGEAE